MSEDLLTRRIIGAALEVHRILGPGLLESVYEFALCWEFQISELAYRRQVPVNIVYKGHTIKGQRLDFVVENGVVVELKAAQGMPPTALAQILTYLKATEYNRGLIINFGAPRLSDGIKRVSL